MSRILIVEDNKDHRRLLRSILSRLNFDILEAGTTAEAETMLESETIDLLILDHGLPNKLGADWYYQYLQTRTDRRKDIPVLFITVYGMSAEVKKLARERKVVFLPKPLEATDLLDAAKNLLKQ